MTACKKCGHPTIFGDLLCSRCWGDHQDQAERAFRRRVVSYGIMVGFLLALISVIVYFLVERYG